jgi:hypothetical protein
MAKRFYNIKQVNVNNMIDVMAIENLYIDKSLSEEPIYQIKFKNNNKPMIIEESDYYQLLSIIETIEM